MESPIKISGSGSSVSKRMSEWTRVFTDDCCAEVRPGYPHTVVARTGLHIGVPPDRAVPHRERWGGAADPAGWLRFLVPQIPSRHLREELSEVLLLSSYPKGNVRNNQTSCSQPRVYVSRSLPSLWSQQHTHPKSIERGPAPRQSTTNSPVTNANEVAFCNWQWRVELDSLGAVDQHA